MNCLFIVKVSDCEIINRAHSNKYQYNHYSTLFAAFATHPAHCVRCCSRFTVRGSLRSPLTQSAGKLSYSQTTMALDLGLGWVDGDAERLLLALGLSVSRYTIDQVIVCMNDLGEFSPGSVAKVRSLLSDWDNANTEYQQLNTSSEGRTLIKADVLEWSINESGYSIEKEFSRIQVQLMQYFGSCPIIMEGSSGGGYTELLRS